MPIKYEELMALKTLGQKYSYTDRDVMLYAYGIGMGGDPLDERELVFVNEAGAAPRALKVVPTFASVAVLGAGRGEMNINRVMSVDGERDKDGNVISFEAKVKARGVTVVRNCMTVLS